MCIYMQHVVKIMSQKHFTNSMCHTDITISMHHMSQGSSTWTQHMQQGTWCHELTVSCKSTWHQHGCNTCDKRHWHAWKFVKDRQFHHGKETEYPECRNDLNFEDGYNLALSNASRTQNVVYISWTQFAVYITSRTQCVM